MYSDDKCFAIFVTALVLGIGGSLIAGWPAAVSAGVVIIFIAKAKEPRE